MENKELKLAALEAAGVENWEGYSEALDIYESWMKEEREQEKMKEILDEIYSETEALPLGDGMYQFSYIGNIKNLLKKINQLKIIE